MKAILKITGKPDVIIVSSAHPFHYPVLERFARKNNTKLIFEVRDLWPLSLMKILNTPKWHPLVLYLSYIEKRAYKNADHVVSLLGGALAYMKNKGLSEERYHFIPNGTSINDHQISSPLSKNLNEHIQNLKRKNTFMLGYAGALGKPNALIYLIEAMRIIQKENHSIHCMIVGNGHLEAELKQAVLNHGLKNISFFSAIDKLEVGSFLKQMNALYLGWNDTDIYKYGVSPNKLYDYMLAGCPIIESGGADQSIIEQVECGIRCEAANVFAIAEAIKTMSLMEHKERVTMGLKGQQACINKFDYSILARDYMTVFAS